jgi:L-ascorbate metabolism protein UlaG (beta-lactamase superfamily)
VRITRHGHACLLVESGDTRVLIDPGAFSSPDAFALTDLDAVVVTHQHLDHWDRERGAALLRANAGAVLLADPETAAELGDPWRAHRDGDRTDLRGATLVGVGATHAEILPTLPRVANVGVRVEGADGVTLFHPGDSYEHAPAGVDVLALPLSAPWAKVSETVAFARRVAPRVAFPVHDRTISELAQGMYLGHVENHAGLADFRRLGQADATTVDPA